MSQVAVIGRPPYCFGTGIEGKGTGEGWAESRSPRAREWSSPHDIAGVPNLSDKLSEDTPEWGEDPVI